MAGEYFVAAELSRRGFIASISLRNTRGIDILATNAEATHSITIQCKTDQTLRSTWVLNVKCESFVADDHFYVFVILSSPLERARYYIV
ncbi:MAG: aspartate ammonia-lyase, partial [Armatimonadota bacterium]